MITNIQKVIKTLEGFPGEFAEVKNPSYVFPPVEYYPLAAPLKQVSELKAALMDMDGTTTTTEVLCIHSLELMIRRMSGKLTPEQWPGVDHDSDLAHIIGNSTTKHVEYLMEKYGHLFIPECSAREYLSAVHWTLTQGMDAQRKEEVIQNLKKIKLGELEALIKSGITLTDLLEKFTSKVPMPDFNMQVNLGIDIYYESYHRILALLKEGKSEQVKKQVFGDEKVSGNLISPMPGIPVLIPLIKGWLGEEAVIFADDLIQEYENAKKTALSDEQKEQFRQELESMGKAFEEKPLKLALVTSSIFYEADIVIREILKVMTEVINRSALSRERKEHIMQAYTSYRNVYDAFITATDASEIRLKPHRDLYSMALHQVGLMPADFDKVIGFEDSQSGTVAIRAAGIGCCIAVPFAQTSSHNLEAATHILPAGIPEALIDFKLFRAQK